MRYSNTAQMLALALCTSAILMGAGPKGCGPIDNTQDLPDPDPDPECPAVCDIACRYGNVLDENGCPTCECNPPPLCQSDADCSMGQVCDTSVCLSPCDGNDDVACPAVCWGQCIDVQQPSCDPGDPNACGDGWACVCRGVEPCGDGDHGAPRDDGRGDGNSSDRPTGFLPPPADGCSCEPIAPPPPQCDPTDPYGCGEGAACVCAIPADGGFRPAPCDEDGCEMPEPICWCEPIQPPTCDPAAPMCGEGSECVCFADAERPACDPNDSSCFLPPPPVDQCYCVETMPPPPSCTIEDPTCPDGSLCECASPGITCDPAGENCLPPPPECRCVPQNPPMPEPCDPSDPMCQG